jgi:TPR repeat protein
VLSRGKRLLGGGLILLLAGMAAALIGLGKLPAAAGWTAVGLAAAAGLSGVLLTPLAERLRLRIATAHGRTTAVQGLLRTGALQELLVHEADPIRLGVHPAWKLPGAAPVPPYVPRTIDAELDRKLASGGLVVVQGDSAAGKSRTAYEALRRNATRLGWRSLVVPHDPAALRTLAEGGSRLARTVVWLDDLERYLSADGLDEGLLSALCPPGRTHVVLLATLRARAREALRVDSDEPVAAEMANSARRVLGGTEPVRLDRELDPAERATAEQYRSDPRIAAALDSTSGAGLAEHLAAGPAAVQRWQAGREGANEHGAALVSAAVDLRRAGYLEPVPLEWLAELRRAYLPERTRNRHREGDFADALTWATTPVRGASSCLLPAGQDRYLAFDYLVDHVELQPGAPEVPDEVWQRLHATTLLSAAELHSVAWAAHRHGRIAEAVRLYSVLAAAGQVFATFNLGWIAQVRGDLAEAERWYRRAAEAGNDRAMTNLGTLAERRGDLTTAESWFRQAAAAGSTMAIANLGGVLLRTGRIEQARAAYRQAAAAGDLAGLHKEAVLEFLHGDPKRATDLLERAALAGHPASVRSLGLLSRVGEDKDVDQEQVETLYRAAAELGDVQAMCEMARARVAQGKLDEAEIWYRRAAAAEPGGPHGSQAEFELAVLLDEGRGRVSEAEGWYRRSAEHGRPEAMLNLGTVLEARGEDGEAERWYHKALAMGYLFAEVNLGTLHRRRGDLAEARSWYQRAAARGDEPAKRGLQQLEEPCDPDTGPADG